MNLSEAKLVFYYYSAFFQFMHCFFFFILCSLFCPLLSSLPDQIKVDHRADQSLEHQ
ncbi:hypothetical protein Bca4012_009395 [Brassica carinata]